MLRYLGMDEKADGIERSITMALDQGVRTIDAGGRLGTNEFTSRLIDVIGTG
jgi:isocitrate/isopropylmalate dehydrogenase